MPIITNPQANDPQNNPSHSQLHRDEVDAINALEGDIVKKFTKDIAGEIEDLTEKTTLHNDDLILIEDSEDIYNKKKVKKSNLSTNLNKASGSDIDTGTDNDKYVTPKAIADSKIVLADKQTSGNILRTPKTGTFASGSTTYQQTDATVTANSLIDVYAQGTTIGQWSVESYAGYFIITSTETETSNVNFSYFINNI